MTRCPCGSGSPYSSCCEPIHGGSPAPTAERLMRSRYSAFTLGLVDYLRHSWHPDTVPADFGADDVRLEEGYRWVRLAVEQTEAGGPFDTEGYVTFTAIARGPEGRIAQRERSRFVRLPAAAAGGLTARRWVYLDGQPLEA
ncbi:YchJ family protein [Leucobacter sp. UCMA 4100]|uniref:YchJ family protein n=1 Tax=Leucobacter sp. UCMA 4100 TaxID=2810534 RepID=UPI0022EAC184|nr:YchJ family metal-binding protein [Leucobacter sp. UCMA 4100]